MEIIYHVDANFHSCASGPNWQMQLQLQATDHVVKVVNIHAHWLSPSQCVTSLDITIV